MLALQGPVNPFFGALLEFFVIDRVGEGYEAADVVRAFFPCFAVATEPGGVGSEGVVELFGGAGEAGFLELQLSLEPTLGANRAEGEADERRRYERGAIRHDSAVIQFGLRGDRISIRFAGRNQESDSC